MSAYNRYRGFHLIDVNYSPELCAYCFFAFENIVFINLYMSLIYAVQFALFLSFLKLASADSLYRPFYILCHDQNQQPVRCPGQLCSHSILPVGGICARGCTKVGVTLLFVVPLPNYQPSLECRGSGSSSRSSIVRDDRHGRQLADGQGPLRRLHHPINTFMKENLELLICLAWA